MPEVVVPTTKNGKARTWAQVFPDVPEGDDWVIINNILENIAMTNRYGCGIAVEPGVCSDHFSWEQHRDHLIAAQREFYAKIMTAEPTKKDLYQKFLDMWMKYIPQVYENFAGAYREWNS